MLRKWMENILWKDKTMLGPYGMGLPFYLLSLCFLGLSFFRELLYAFSFLRCKKLPLKVISVGNLQLGGTGKTPFSLFLAKNFLQKGKKVALLSRGYGFAAEKAKEPLPLCLGNGPQYPASLAGDEPLMLAKNLPNIYAFVGKDRVRAAQMALDADCDIALLDDAFQQRRLKKDFEIVLLDALEPFANHYLLPRGPLREAPKALQRADLVCLSGLKDRGHFAKLKERIQPYTKAPIIALSLKLEKIFNKNHETFSMQDQPVAIFCAIARPERFRQSVKELGAKVVKEFFFKDHERIAQETISRISEEAKKAGAKFLLCTEKDWHRWDCLPTSALELVYLKTSVEILEGKEIFDKSIQRFLLA